MVKTSMQVGLLTTLSTTRERDDCDKEKQSPLDSSTFQA